MYGLNLTEMKQADLRSYETLQTNSSARELKAGVRTIVKPHDLTTITSPCDGRVLTCREMQY